MSIGPVVIIEDDEAIGEALTECLSSEGYGVVLARNGMEGLRALQVAPRPLAVILDLAMPLMNGTEVLHRLDEDHSTVPVIVTSAEVEGLALSKAKYVLRKPYALADLFRILDSLLARPTVRTSMSGSAGKVALIS